MTAAVPLLVVLLSAAAGALWIDRHERCDDCRLPGHEPGTPDCPLEAL